MLVARSQISSDGLDLEIHEEPRWEGVEGLWVSLTPVEATLRLERKGSGVLVTGAFTTTAVVLCCRCAEPVAVPLSDQFAVLYVGASEAYRGEEIELSDAEMDVNAMTDDGVDLSGLLRENVLLNLPLQPLCRAECRGLCPHCGINLNEASCSCRVQEPDPRLLPLQHLL